MSRYSTTAVALHWLIAALLVYNYALGERAEHLRQGASLFAVLQLHKSIGITVLLLSVVRLAIRFWRPAPVAVIDNPAAKYLSSAVHALFYVVMIGAPLTGWIIVSTAKIEIPTLLFGVVPWPHLPFAQGWHRLAEDTHALLSTLMLALIALHVIGAVRHQFVMNDGLLDRMMPTARAGLGAFAVALALLGGSYALGQVGPIPGIEAVSAPGIATETTPIERPLSEAKQTEAPDEVTAPNEEVPEKEIAAGPVPSWQPAAGGQLGFNVTVDGEQVTGRFGRWSSMIVFDPERLDESSIRTSIDLTSVTTGDGERDNMLAGSDFFATAANPQAIFTSSDIRNTGGNRYQARGTLTLKGVSRPTRLDFTLDIKGDKATASGTATLSRSAFGVGTGQFEGDGTIGTSVAVNFRFNATRQ
jgi:cytochrome b561/polyisoprenoid-binding protein YceI